MSKGIRCDECGRFTSEETRKVLPYQDSWFAGDLAEIHCLKCYREMYGEPAAASPEPDRQ